VSVCEREHAHGSKEREEEVGKRESYLLHFQGIKKNKKTSVAVRFERGKERETERVRETESERGRERG